MTETLFVLVTAFAGLLFSDPFYAGALTKASIAKLPLLALAGGSLFFHLLGRALTDPARLRVAAGEVVRGWWPMLGLAGFVILGSSYARWGDDVKENFLAMGLGMTFLPLVALAVHASEHRLAFLKALGAVTLLTVLGMLAILLSEAHIFHEEIFLMVPLGAYFLAAPRGRWWQVLFGLLLIALCLFSVKNTTFLLVLLTLAFCGLLALLRMLRKSNRLAVVTGLYFGIPVLVGAVVALYLTHKRHRPDLPSGNVEYRIEMYTTAWNRFIESPIWGSMFTDSSVNYFELYRVALATQNLPTHSDVLDLLAHGGLLAIGLWLLVMWRLGRIGWAAIHKLAHAEPEDGPLRGWRCLFVLALVQVCAVATYAVNPPLISPVHGFWIWGSAGAMWALHQALTNPAPQRRPRWQLPRPARLAR